jgi:3-mercaptopyruvate sulfurtransferase SseA
MLAELMKRKRLVSTGLAIVLLAAGLALWGCADHPTEYNDPAATIVTTKTPTALIEAATLAEWIDEGRLNSTDPDSRDKVVILTVSTAAAYATGHIEGSQLWNYDTEVFQTRLEGVAAMSSMVPTGPVLDALLCRFGIDEHTTVVFTTSTTGSARDLREATRGWWTLRYWGFPKDRIKVLQGGDVGWTTAGFTLVTDVPAVTPSVFSVRELAATSEFGADYRASIGEVIRAVDGINSGALTDVKILDTRGGVDPVAGGKLMPAALDTWNGYYVAGTSGTLKPLDEMVARLATFGVTESTPLTYVNCQGGVKCTVVFFVLDGMLGWPVQSYDGSWGQWSGYSNASIAAAWKVAGTSPAGDTPGTTIQRSFGTWTAGSPAIDPVANSAFGIADPRANQIENEDAAYFSSGGTTTPPAGGGGGGGGSGC